MFAEIGIFALILSLMFALLLVIVPSIGLYRRQISLINTVPFFIYGQFLFLIITYISLTICFIKNDFTVIYVLMNSSVDLPWFYKMCAVWGGHEGSMLLWVLILSCWTTMLYCFSKHQLPKLLLTRILIILGILNIGFLLFLIITSNPFLRQFTILNTHGKDLNPLLQDLGFLFHPPLLYVGYVGFAITFAFAMTILWLGQIQSQWMRWLRPWVLMPWCCLTIGITLGSWWAYRELGWGGFWFWDPVENASLMPWLVGTALIHSLIVSEKRNHFVDWTLLLAIIAFSLSLIGTFLVRSGVLTSVHAFASDPSRGIYILGFLMIIIGGGLLLFACRIKSVTMKFKQLSGFSWLSRENALLLETILFIVIMLTILLGTVYPLLIDGLGLGKLSVGAPYFNTVITPIVLPILILMSLGIHVNWQRGFVNNRTVFLGIGLIACLVATAVNLKIFGGFINVYTLIAVTLSLWVLASAIIFMTVRIYNVGILKVKSSTWGMIIAHCGIPIMIIGIALSAGYGIQRDIKLAPGQSEKFLNYVVTFVNESNINSQNYHGVRGHFLVQYYHVIHHIYPEKRIYNISKMVMTEAAIDITPFRDLYIALGEPLDGQSWSVRIYFKPFIRWIWCGGFLIFFGGILAIMNHRPWRR